LAVNTAEIATPDALVVAVLTPPVNVPLAPLVGAVNVTIEPLTALPPESFTVATSGNAKALLITAVCGVPLVAEIVDVVPPVLVSEKLAGVATPGADAVTV
jgi:hypothetical protein